MKSVTSKAVVTALVVAGLSVASQARADQRPPVALDAVGQALVALERESWTAWKARDGAFFDRFLTAEHLDVGAGGPSDKKTVVAGVASHACKVDSYEITDFHVVRISADTAALVYRAQQTTTCGSVLVPSPAWATSVYVRHNGAWHNALYQQTPIGAP